VTRERERERERERVNQVDSHGRWKGPCLQANPQCAHEAKNNVLTGELPRQFDGGSTSAAAAGDHECGRGGGK
jgi:hypothetical protein